MGGARASIAYRCRRDARGASTASRVAMPSDAACSGAWTAADRVRWRQPHSIACVSLHSQRGRCGRASAQRGIARIRDSPQTDATRKGGDKWSRTHRWRCSTTVNDSEIYNLIVVVLPSYRHRSAKDGDLIDSGGDRTAWLQYDAQCALGGCAQLARMRRPCKRGGA